MSVCIVDQLGPADIGAAADLWLVVDEARSGRPFGSGYIREQRAGFIAAASRPDAWLIVAKDGDDLVGLVGGFPFAAAGDLATTGPRTHLGWLAVTPTRWGHGVADALMQAAEDGARRSGVDHIVLSTHADNGRARRFYERRGWTLTGNTERTPQDNELLIEYRLDLRATE